jgi:tetratricopeptide (TPR) repeat protein
LAEEHNNRGEILLALGREQDALLAYQSAGTIWEREFGVDSAPLAYSLTGSGTALIRLGRYREAALALERALAIREKRDKDDGRLAETKSALAAAIFRRGGDPRRSVELARQALQHYERVPESRDQRSEMASLLAKIGTAH